MRSFKLSISKFKFAGTAILLFSIAAQFFSQSVGSELAIYSSKLRRMSEVEAALTRNSSPGANQEALIESIDDYLLEHGLLCIYEYKACELIFSEYPQLSALKPVSERGSVKTNEQVIRFLSGRLPLYASRRFRFAAEYEQLMLRKIGNAEGIYQITYILGSLLLLYGLYLDIKSAAE